MKTSESETTEEYDLQTYYSEDGLTERDRLEFAKQILFFLFLLVVLVFSASYILLYYSSDNKELVSVVNLILDITKTVIPATATLVLGFYFGKNAS